MDEIKEFEIKNAIYEIRNQLENGGNNDESQLALEYLNDIEQFLTELPNLKKDIERFRERNTRQKDLIQSLYAELDSLQSRQL